MNDIVLLSPRTFGAFVVIVGIFWLLGFFVHLFWSRRDFDLLGALGRLIRLFHLGQETKRIQRDVENDDTILNSLDNNNETRQGPRPPPRP